MQNSFQIGPVDNKATDRTQFKGTDRLTIWQLLETKEQPEGDYCCTGICIGYFSQVWCVG